MKRRDFLTASAVATSAFVIDKGMAAEKVSASKGCLELRRYEFESVEKRKVFEDFLGEAFIPALNRQGIRPVGVFVPEDNEGEPVLWVLIPHEGAGSVIASNTKMLEDPIFVQAGGDVINCEKKDPVYKRFTSSLLLCFDKCPKVEVPSNKDTRVFQLRIYESHNVTKAKRKVEMFNAGGEIDIFRSTGLNPVFFGETIVGEKMPCLNYMVGFDDAEAKQKGWDEFKKHPDWKKISSDPYYKDTVSNITNIVMKPSAASQI